MSATPELASINPEPSKQDVSHDHVAAPKKQFSLSAKEFFYSLEEWEQIDLNTPDNLVLIGTPANSIIRPGTKNIIEAPEKTFKTTTLLRLTIGVACGHTVFESLPVARPVRVLYIHGEMTPRNLRRDGNPHSSVSLPRNWHGEEKTLSQRTRAGVHFKRSDLN